MSRRSQIKRLRMRSTGENRKGGRCPGNRVWRGGAKRSLECQKASRIKMEKWPLYLTITKPLVKKPSHP